MEKLRLIMQRLSEGIIGESSLAKEIMGTSNDRSICVRWVLSMWTVLKRHLERCHHDVVENFWTIDNIENVENHGLSN